METEVKYCKMCRKALPPLSDREYCYACEELLLFDKVREFVRNNDVNEYQVAEYFDIPVRMVKQWIKGEELNIKKRIKQVLCRIIVPGADSRFPLEHFVHSACVF